MKMKVQSLIYFHKDNLKNAACDLENDLKFLVKHNTKKLYWHDFYWNVTFVKILRFVAEICLHFTCPAAECFENLQTIHIRVFYFLI